MALILAAGVGLLGTNGASAVTQVAPAPLDGVAQTAARLVPAPPPADPTQPAAGVVGTVTGALAGTLTGAAATRPSSGSRPSTQSGPRPAPSSAKPSAKTPPSRAHVAPAHGDDAVVAADVTVRDLLGACVRLTRAGVPVRTTVVVLDQNLIDQLSAVGLPLERLLVPCPAGATSGTTGGSSGTTQGSSGTTSAAATIGDPAQAGILGPLAFTGTNLAATLLLGGGLLALGLAFLRKANSLVVGRGARTDNA